VVDQIAGMHGTIKKLNVELMSKQDKERTLEMQVMQPRQNHDQRIE